MKTAPHRQTFARLVIAATVFFTLKGLAWLVVAGGVAGCFV